MKRLKYLLWLVVILLVAIFVSGFFVDGIAKSAIESAGSEALGVKTTVDKVSLGLFGGTFTMEGEKVANPEGFGGGNFFELGKGSVEVSAMSLFSDTIEVPALELSKIRVNLIQGANGSNYGKILDNLKKYQGEPSTEEDSGEGKRFIIRKLVIDDVEVQVAPAKELNLAALKLPVDRIELKDVGSESDKGVLLSDLAGIVVESILKRASVSGGLPDLIKGGLKGDLDQLRGLADAGIKGFKIKDLESFTGGSKVPGGLPKGLDDAKNKLKKGIGGLLGR